MNYSLQNLTQTVDCDVLLSRAQKRRADLNHKKYSEEGLSVRYGETTLDIEASLQATISEIAALEVMISSLPEGPFRDERSFEKQEKEFKVIALNHRLKKYGVVALLEQEMDVNLIDQQIEEVDAFIVAVTARKEQLASAA